MFWMEQSTVNWTSIHPKIFHLKSMEDMVENDDQIIFLFSCLIWKSSHNIFIS